MAGGASCCPVLFCKGPTCLREGDTEPGVTLARVRPPAPHYAGRSRSQSLCFCFSSPDWFPAWGLCQGLGLRGGVPVLGETAQSTAALHCGAPPAHSCQAVAQAAREPAPGALTDRFTEGRGRGGGMTGPGVPASITSSAVSRSRAGLQGDTRRVRQKQVSGPTHRPASYHWR